MDNERKWTLDLVRVCSMLMIFLFHANIHMNCTYGIFTAFISQGAIFMVAFFMVSGCSLFYRYRKENLDTGEKLWTFYRKRLASIYPGYLCIVILYLLLPGSMSFIRRILLLPLDLVCLQSMVGGSFGVLHHGGTWFISCIVLCYLLFPVISGMIKKITLKTDKILLVIIYLLCGYIPLAAYVMAVGTTYSNPLFRLCEFTIGMILAHIYSRKAEETRSGGGYFLSVGSSGLSAFYFRAVPKRLGKL